MKLEKAIRQKGFQNEYQKAIINIIYTHNYLIGKMNPVFKQYGITRQQYNVLRILRGQHPDPATINLIKERMLDKMSDASRIAERLKKKKLIEKSRNLIDKRAADIIISKKGLALLKTMDPESKKFNKLITLSDGEVANLNKILDNLRD
ncbi:MAG: MarR family transcriptional regulator [Bacteroidetes bacterium]|nr:MarR family transcriptional regulator [Bacteroidota bacterium]